MVGLVSSECEAEAARTAAPNRGGGTRLANTQAAAGLVLAEEVLRRLKDAAAETELWNNSRVNSNEMLQAGTPVCDIELMEPDEDGDAHRKDDARDAGSKPVFMEKHWRRARGEPADETFFFVARRAEPSYLTIRTFSRMAYVEGVLPFVRSLDGLPVSVSEDQSWTWDHEKLTEAGRRAHRRVYVLNVGLNENKPFSAARWLRFAAADVCRSRDSRADQCVLQMLENAGLPRKMVTGYTCTRHGWLIDCTDSGSAARLAETLFSDCVCQTKRCGRHVQLSIVMPG